MDGVGVVPQNLALAKARGALALGTSPASIAQSGAFLPEELLFNVDVKLDWSILGGSLALKDNTTEMVIGAIGVSGSMTAAADAAIAQAATASLDPVTRITGISQAKYPLLYTAEIQLSAAINYTTVSRRKKEGRKEGGKEKKNE